MQDRLTAKGLSVPLIVMGGTPTFTIYAETPGVEASPGTFIFHDYGYTTRYPDLGFTPAALLLSRVISIPTPHRITLDLGHKAIAADPDGVRGVVLNIDDAEVSMQHEEHWAINVPDSTPMHIGQEIYVCPTHICPCVALHPFYYVVDTDGYCRGHGKSRHAIGLLREPVRYDAQGHGKNGAGTFAAQLMSVHTTAMLNSPKTMPKKNGRSR